MIPESSAYSGHSFNYRPVYDASFFKKFRSAFSFSGQVCNKSGSPITTGAVGLSNVGNTCFMNAVLQCLSNTPSIKSITNNTVSMPQSVSKESVDLTVRNSFSRLINDLWEEKYSALDTRPFKAAVDSCCPLFIGNNQHDAAEFLQFLLDNLHCSYTVNSPQKSSTAALSINEQWEKWKLSNGSPLVNLFFGLTQSTLFCEVCRHETMSCDVFNLVPVPIIDSKVISIQVLCSAPSVVKRSSVITIEVPEGPQPVASFLSLVLRHIAESPSLLPCKVPFFLDSFSKLLLLPICEIAVLNKDIPFSMTKFLARNDDVMEILNVGDRLAVVNSYILYNPAMRSIPITEIHSSVPNLLQKVIFLSTKTSVNSVAPIGLPFSLSFVSDTPANTIMSACKLAAMQYILGSNPVLSTENQLQFASFYVVNSTSLAIIREFTDSSTASLHDTESIAMVFENQDFESNYLFIQQSQEILTFCKQEGFYFGNTLTQSLSQYFSEERLTLENSRACHLCKKRQIHIRKLELYSVPEILIVQIKRFKYDVVSGSSEKDERPIHYPRKNLNLAEYYANGSDMPRDCNYDLYGVILHSGSLNGGHYTALALNDNDKRW